MIDSSKSFSTFTRSEKIYEQIRSLEKTAKFSEESIREWKRLFGVTVILPILHDEIQCSVPIENRESFIKYLMLERSDR